jgi:hypothetical protein
MIKGHGLFNQFTREHSEDGKAIWVNQTDIDEGYRICKSIIESNEFGLPPHAYQFWKKKLKPILDENGMLRKEVANHYFDHYQIRIGKKRLTNLIELFESTGLIFEDIDPEDKRYKRIYPQQGGGEKTGKTECMRINERE